MANFNLAYDRTARAEGGYTDNPRDKGNYVCSNGSWVTGNFPFRCSSGSMHLVGTNHGISAPKLYGYMRRLPTVADMRGLTKAAAKDIYKKDEWRRIMGDSINSQSVADIFFDGAVNHGSGTAIRMMQRVVGVTADGVMGSVTLRAINMGNASNIYERFKQARIDLYNSIVARDSSQGIFLTGWMRRINSFDDFAGNSGGGGVLAAMLLLVGFYFVKM